MRTLRLGTTELTVSALGFGAIHLSLERRPPEDEALAVIHRALALGITFIDTADSYCRDDSERHHNERLIHRALQTYPGDTSRVVVATKGGMVRPRGAWVVHGEPEHLRQAIRRSFEALGGKRPIDLWQLHAIDARYQLEDCLAVAREAVEQRLVRHVGLSNTTLPQLQRAQRILRIVSVQNEYNPWQRSSEFNGMVSYCEAERLTFIPWSPLGGPHRAGRLLDLPWLAEMAGARGVSPQRWLLAWMKARSPCIVPIPGASRIETLEDSAAAAELELTPEEVRRADKLMPHRRRVL